MNRTFDTIALRITPLTPVHVGCGTDFDPTNYVIDGDLLYHFDPSLADLGDAGRNALRAALKGRGTDLILQVQRFFHAQREVFKGVATGCVSVSVGVASQYRDRIGTVAQREADGSRVVNLLEIERTSHHPHSGIPYLPGSSLKGAMRTAWLDKVNGGRGRESPDEKGAAMERRVLGGSFHQDPFRLVRVADAAGSQVASKVFFATNHRKQEVTPRDGQPPREKDLAVRREAILGGQMHALAGEIRFDLLAGVGEPKDRDGKLLTPGTKHRIADFAALAKACNAFYLKRLEAECAILEGRRFAEPAWLASFLDLVKAMRPDLDDGRVMLLRVGRHSGAESVTPDGVRNIRIMTGRDKPLKWSSDGATTLWLAAETERDRSGMLPFGWLLAELADTPPDPSVEGWCADQPRTDLAAIRARLADARHRATEEAERLRRIAAERQAHELAEAARHAEREAALASMRAEGKLIAEFVEACEARQRSNRKDPCNPGAGIYGRASALAKVALADGGGWSPDDRVALAQALSEWLPRVVDKLDRKDDWKDARKRLKLAVLLGQ